VHTAELGEARIRKPRADALRNHALIVDAARVAFAARGSDASMDEIARAAGVGIGTLYRHFPTREALVEAVFCTELAEVAASADELLERHPPAVALRRWMDRYAGFVAAKRGMAESLRAMFAAGVVEPGDTRETVVGAVQTLLRAGAADGSLRDDVSADDVVFSLIGIFLASQSTDQAGRMLDLLLDGLVAARDRDRAGS